MKTNGNKTVYPLPLIVMTPKSLLRHKLCVSALHEFTDGSFLRVIDDEQITEPAEISRVALCSGKIYYDLVAARRENEEVAGVALVRAAGGVVTELAGQPWTASSPSALAAAPGVHEEMLDIVRAAGVPEEYL